MSGETKSAKDKLDMLETALENYEENLGINKCKYLIMSEDEIKSLQPEDLETAACSLGALSFHIQKAVNKQQVRVNWAERHIRRVIGEEYNNVKAYSPEERRFAIISYHEHAKSLDKIQENAQAAIDKLAFITKRIEFLAERFSKLQEIKRRNKYG